MADVPWGMPGALELAREWEPIDRALAHAIAWAEPVLVLRGGLALWLQDRWLHEHGAHSGHEHARYYRRRRPEPFVVLPPIDEAEQEEDERSTADEDTFVEFRFEYPDGTAAGGLDYVLVDPQRKETQGTLGSNGTLTKRGIPPGGYSVILKDVEAAFFASERRQCDDTLELTARTSGFPDGTAAKVKLYRELRESSADALLEVDAEVNGDRIVASLEYDYASDEERAAETGAVRVLAEVSVENGKYWTKTSPVELALKTLRSVTWSAERVEAGNPLEVRVETSGYGEGASATLEIWRLDWLGGHTKVADVGPIDVVANRAIARGAYASSDGADFVLDEPGEYYALAKIEDNVTRSARTGLVWCAWLDMGEMDDSDPDSDPDSDSASESESESGSEAA